jgi:tRNA threonylcarbamoyladenosine biosynthesis protein TsaE
MNAPAAGAPAGPIVAEGLGPDDVRRVGEAVGRVLEPGRAVALTGDLGAGKTFLIQAICTGLGVGEPVTSPTFALVNVYRGRVPVYHIDLYRIGDGGELDEIGLEEFFAGEGVSLVEWAERASGRIPSPRIDVSMVWAGPETRDVAFDFVGRGPWRPVRRAIEDALGR